MYSFKNKSSALFFLLPLLVTFMASSIYIAFMKRFASFHLDANVLFDIPDISTTNLSPLELNGRNWIPILKTRMHTCLNLERLIKSTGNVTSEERDLWGRLHCLDELRELDGLW
jgi:hypothetical protein